MPERIGSSSTVIIMASLKHIRDLRSATVLVVSVLVMCSMPQLVFAQRPTCGMGDYSFTQRREVATLVARSTSRRAAFGTFRLSQEEEFDARIDVRFHVIVGSGGRGMRWSLLTHTHALSFLICLFRTYVRKCIGRDKYMSGTDAVWSSADK